MLLLLQLTRNMFPPDVGSCLERVTAPAIALIELASFDAWGVGLLDPAARIVMGEPVAYVPQFGRSGIMPIPQVRRHRDHRLRFDISHRRADASAG